MNSLLVLKLGFLLFQTEAPDPVPVPPIVPVHVQSIRRHPSSERTGEYMVKIAGTVEADPGDLLVLRLAPVILTVADNGALVPATTLDRCLTCRARVGTGGEYTALFSTTRLQPHEVQILRMPARSSNVGKDPVKTPAGLSIVGSGTLALCDPSQMENRNRDFIAAFEKNSRTLLDFLEDIRPYGDRGEPVPMKHGHRLYAVETPIRLWTQTSPYFASGSALCNVMTDLGKSVPWADESDERDDGRMFAGYGERKPLSEGKRSFQVDPWIRRVESARNTLLREILHSTLGPAEEILSRLSSGEDSREAEKGIGFLARLCASLESGSLEAEFSSFPPAAEMRQHLSAIETLATGTSLPDPEQIRNLQESIKLLSARILNPDPPAKP